MAERKEYKCDKCKSSVWLKKANTYCVCGGKIYPTEVTKDVIDELFNGFKGAK